MKFSFGFFGIKAKITTFLKNRFRPSTEPFVYVAIGDSTVEGIGASDPTRSFAHLVYESIKEKQRNTLFYNLGKSGARIQDVLNEQLDKAIALKPDLVIISIGGNDVRRRTKLVNFTKDFETLVKRLKEETQAEIIVNNILDLSLSPSLPLLTKFFARLWVNKFNQKIKQLSENARILYIDLHTQSRMFVKKYPEFIAADGFHPSDTGYALWANTIISHMNSKSYTVN